MAQRILRLSLFLVFAALAACGPSSSNLKRSGELTTSTNDIPPPADHVPLIKDQADVNKLPPYVVPEKLRERLKEVAPEIRQPEPTTQFDIVNQNLNISVKNKSFTFTGTLKIPGRQDEKLELACKFDPAQIPWECNDMFPTDEKVAKDRRLQATVNCLDVYQCKELGVEVFVVINGKTHSQLFQTEPFTIRRAESGDEDEDYLPPKTDSNGTYVPPDTKGGSYTPPVNGGGTYTPPTQGGGSYTPPTSGGGSYKPPVTSVPDKTGPKVFEKPTPGVSQMEPETEPSTPAVPAPTPMEPEPQEQINSTLEPEEEEILSDDEINEAMSDPNQAVEVSTPMNMPQPAASKYSIPGIQKLRPKVGEGVPNQAIRKSNAGSLVKGARLPQKGSGFICTSDENYGADIMIEMIIKASEKIANKSPVVVRDISKKTGGKLKGHASHQNGLDVDISFPAEKQINHFFAACPTHRVTKKGRTSTVCIPGRAISKDLDEGRFWTYLKAFTCTDAPTQDGKVVGAIFLDATIKKHMCNYVRGTGESTAKGSCGYKALQILKHEGNHHHHIHVRLKCPGNRDCRPAPVTLAEGTGC